MIELDGSVGEGGGQILRTGLALAMCTGQPLRIHSIRAKRPKPGLMRQHLSCVQAAQAISSAVVSGAELGSSSLQFEPGAVRAGDYRFAVGSAGSCTLVLQTVLPALMRANAPSRIELSGGTHNPMAPPFHFIERCFAPLLKRMGVGLALQLRRHGFYPAGGGEAVATITPAEHGLQPFDLLHRGALREVYAECLVPGLPRGVATRELSTLGEAMGWSNDQLRTPAVRQDEGPGNALMATLAYEQVTELVTAFGEKNRSAESVAAAAVAELRVFQAGSGAVGPHLADQLALPLALAVHDSGRTAAYSFTELTEHARTNFEVIEAFLPVRCETQGADGAWRVTISPH
ncbi:MAG TPA: RNA 3'-terminal phosphate cyclase [Ideonella sp.]|uniref:RNA 3'-terminal phosphate cyclase n=1 Tax=Ideonella sp. TaxID=1929293 RepID=UPI002E2EE748|nr:RNA 3'-terminal phosphate cyclase [Ideonella sp.]HEX5682958.1 RNA 3'-terminal phosphate cyclase [Ideonella sp.]